jgi:citrate lyase subunit beta/citryl-CoA lyase
LADLIALDHHLEALETQAGLPVGGIGVVPITTETTAGVLALPSLDRAPRVVALCFGAEDLAADLGIDPRVAGAYPAPIAAARAMLLLTAARLGLPALDTPYPDPRDPAGLAREAEAAAADGFAGKLCIHPDQIGPVTAAFTPSSARIGWARAVLAGFAANPGSGVFTLEGKMIDRPHLKLAERILASVADVAGR